MDIYAYTATTWDADGDGPEPARVVVAGSFGSAGGVSGGFNSIACWDPCVESWTPLGDGLRDEVYALTGWDPDGDGPLPAQLVAGGKFTEVGGTQLRRIARWDPDAEVWLPFSTGMDFPVYALTTWDPDGDGPLLPQLVAGGEFNTAGGVTVNHIASWNHAAQTWQAFGSGVNGQVSALTSWDPDGAGPLPPQLVVGGYFTSSGATTLNCVARWDPDTQSWLPFDSGMTFSVNALTSWDIDGAGPLPPRLIAGGQFWQAGGVSATNIAWWSDDTQQWHALGLGTDGGVLAATAWDPDEDGPLPTHLLIAGGFTTAGGVTVNEVADWDPAAEEWQALAGGVNGYSIRCDLTTWDPDASGPQKAQPVMAGCFYGAGGVRVNCVARWDADRERWYPFGQGVDPSETIPSVDALAPWDPDGEGPLPERMVAAGHFEAIGGAAGGEIAAWDPETQTWCAFAEALCDQEWSESIRALVSWDPDGDGPLSPQLVAGGTFGKSTPAKRIARWDDASQSWSGFSSGAMNSVNAVVPWDPDGAGPLPPDLVAGGEFVQIGYVSAKRIARWSETAQTWAPFGLGFDGKVYDVTVWDPDGDGPMLAQVVAVGGFVNSGTDVVNHIARWDEDSQTWLPFGTGLTGTDASLECVTTWDPDGEGPEPASLIAAGKFDFPGATAAYHVVQWNGLAQTWTELGPGMNSSIEDTNTWDPDADGPEPVQLVACGWFGDPVHPPARVARWNPGTQTWLPLSSGLDNGGWALAPLDPDGDGPAWPQLVVGGSFTTAGGVPSSRIAFWTAELSFRWQPQSRDVVVGDRIVLGVGTTPPHAAIYEWYRDGVLVDDGGAISGATTATLTISPATLADSGDYTVFVSNGCADLTSAPATVTVGPAGCLGDMNCDGLVDYADIDRFVAALTCIGGDPACWPPAGVPADCPWIVADCDGDGYVNYADIDAFVVRIGATCP